jgi:hypothetical protein
MVGEAIARHLAYPFVLFALSGWLRGRFLLAGGLLGAAISVHVLVGAWAAVAIMPLMFLDDRVGLSRRDRFGPVLISLLFALPGLVQIVPLIHSSELAGSAFADEVFIYFRHPHHLNPGSWPLADYLHFVVVFGVFLLLCRRLPGSATFVRFRQFIGLVTVLTAIGLAIGLIFRDSFFLKLHPFRFGPPVTALMTALLLAAYGFSLRSKGLRWAGAALLVVGVAWYSPRGTYHLYRDAAIDAEEANRRDALRWVKHNTNENAVVLTDPAWSDVQWQSRRAGAVSFKLIPFEPPLILEWYERIRRIDAKLPWSEPGHRMMKRISAAYDGLGADDLVRAANRLGAQVTITRQPCTLPDPVYVNDEYCVHTVGAAPSAAQNYLVVRHDDYSPIQPYDGPSRRLETERRLFALAQRHQGRVAVGVIPFPLAKDDERSRDPHRLSTADSWLSAEGSPWVELLRDAVQGGHVEAVLHGFEHRRTTPQGARPGEYGGQPPDWQLESLRLGRDAVAGAVGRSVSVFVPPWNSWDEATLSALETLQFEVLSPDQHHAAAQSPRIRIVPQCTADPAEALAVMQRETEPNGSILVLVTHPFDFDAPDGAGETYFQGVEQVLEFAKKSPHWVSVGFGDLASQAGERGAERFASAVSHHAMHAMATDLHLTKRGGFVPPDVIRPWHWYQDHLWRWRMILGLALLVPSAGLAWIAFLAGKFFHRSRIAATLGLLLAAVALLYLTLGAWDIVDRGYPIRGARWLAISMTFGVAVGFAMALVFWRGMRQRKNAGAGDREHERYDERMAVPV